MGEFPLNEPADRPPVVFLALKVDPQTGGLVAP